MATLSFQSVGISGMAAAVPRNRIVNREYTMYFDAVEVEEIVEKIGIEERRFAPDGICASDLVYAAAEQLITDLSIAREEIDLLIFVSQTPDYRMPATAVILQERLGLSKHCMAFDISLGCSAFVYALAVVFSMVQQGSIRNALLLDGETRSRVYHPKNRKTAFLFGDGGVAALINKQEKFGDSHFSLNSDGSKENLIKVKAGGYRYPSSVETLEEKTIDEYGNISTDEHGYMNGPDVFNFVILEIPKDVSQVMAMAGITKDDIDYFVFHQANAFMNSYLGKKLKLPTEKLPESIRYFGNTSSVSIPLTIVSQLKDKLSGRKKILLSGFGVGMSWATAIMDFDNIYISELIEI